MSDLQLGLIVFGILVVAGVYAFNRYQELQLRRRVESRFAQPPEDVLMRETAAKHKVVTQMGNQGSAENRLRRAVELIWGGVIGEVREAHIWLMAATGR